ncbi:uncharacterized protein LOC143149813 isoform X4 [Ptiloglossa arizonensis]|uniref:uncharacterized protein LOC143149813 isoform X4 n=1 Tax=Ptiloglossa arizonensis TaxID=3350558 RepID=UPI003F9EC731
MLHRSDASSRKIHRAVPRSIEYLFMTPYWFPSCTDLTNAVLQPWRFNVSSNIEIDRLFNVFGTL